VVGTDLLGRPDVLLPHPAHRHLALISTRPEDARGQRTSRAPLTKTPAAPGGLTARQREAIAAALNERGVSRPCPRCGNATFQVETGIIAHPVQSDLQTLTIGGVSIPVAVTSCRRCGFISEHALGQLGLISMFESAKDAE
jgi:ribosomal protein L37E